jgi:hypothetical protein
LGNLLAVATRDGKLVAKGTGANGPGKIATGTNGTGTSGTGDDLPTAWETESEGPLAGPPLVDNGEVLVAFVSGVVCRHELATGKRLSRVDVGRMLAFGPRKLGTLVCVGGSDGSVLAVETP